MDLADHSKQIIRSWAVKFFKTQNEYFELDNILNWDQSTSQNYKRTVKENKSKNRRQEILWRTKRDSAIKYLVYMSPGSAQLDLWILNELADVIIKSFSLFLVESQ